MLNKHLQPTSLDGIKRLANQLKKSEGLAHHQALNVASRAASYENFAHAHNELKKSGRLSSQSLKRELFLTMYWESRDTRQIGRETLQIELTKPLLELCSKSEISILPGLGWFRHVAEDHLVSDNLMHSQSAARSYICKAVRVLSFLEATGLKPSNDPDAEYPNGDRNNELPRRDHQTVWRDTEIGQFILIDEPYLDPVVDDERKAWADRHNWHIQASAWPSMHNPYGCSLFAATDASTGYDFDALMRKIDSIPEPLIEKNWEGVSVNNFDVFISPRAVTPQDKRRAKAKGTVVRFASKTTIPLHYMSSSNTRKPNAIMPIPAHKKIGRMIKAISISVEKPWSVNARMNSLRSRLEDWLGFECGKEHLQGPEFFDVYYKGIDVDDRYVKQATSAKGNIEVLGMIKDELNKFYPTCAPLKGLLQKVETSIALIQRFENRGK